MLPVTTRTDIALLFPGQGSQTPDMRDDVAREVPDLLDRCIELVGEDPFPRVDESTRFAQPAIFCASMAGWHKLDAEPAMAAGHSLGEIGALTAAGVLELDDAIRLVALRGKLMAEADDTGSMLALLGGTIEDAEAIASERRRHRRQRQRARARSSCPASAARSARPRRPRASTTSAPARSTSPARSTRPRMEPAVAPFREALAEVKLGDPRFPVYCGATAAPFTDVHAELADALIRPVRWRETFLALLDAGAEDFVETGPGTVLSKMARRITKEAAHA